MSSNSAMDEPQDEHFEHDSVILKFIFNKVGEDIITFKLEYDNTTILKNLCEKGLMSEEERQSIISCGIYSIKNT